MKQLDSEKKGEVLILAETVMYSFFPIIVAHTTKIMPPILFAGLSTLAASATLFLYLLFTKKLKSLFHKETVLLSLGVTLFIIILPSIFIFTGSSLTSGINTTILLQTEILFTFFLFGAFRLEKITKRKMIGALIIIVGAVLIVYSGAGVNMGDLLIVAGTVFYPLGNLFAKKALKIAAPSTILFIRNLLGGIALTTISLLFENQSETTAKIANYWPFIVLNGIFIYHLSKILWYEGIKRLDISKAIPMSTGGYPAFSLLFAILFLKEIPTPYQMAGFVIVLAGIYTLIKKDKLLQPVGTE